MADFKLTYATMFNPPEELHTRFDEALTKIKANLGKEHGMLINNKDVFVDEKFEDVGTRLGVAFEAEHNLHIAGNARIQLDRQLERC